MKHHTITVAEAKRLAKAKWSHAGGCKKTPDECGSCQSNITWFASLPLAVLSEVLAEEKQAHRMSR